MSLFCISYYPIRLIRHHPCCTVTLSDLHTFEKTSSSAATHIKHSHENYHRASHDRGLVEAHYKHISTWYLCEMHGFPVVSNPSRDTWQEGLVVRNWLLILWFVKERFDDLVNPNIWFGGYLLYRVVWKGFVKKWYDEINLILWCESKLDILFFRIKNLHC